MSKVNMPNGKAMAKGYTLPAIAVSDDGETVRCLLRDDYDPDGMIAAWDTEAQCWIELNGAFWNVTDDTMELIQ